MDDDGQDLQWVFGFHAVTAIVEKQPRRVREIKLQRDRNDQRLNDLNDSLRRQGIVFEQVEKADLDKLVEGRHQGVVARCTPAQVRGEHELDILLAGLDEPALVLVLDGVTDPHNLGACLRSAEAAGAHAVVFPKDKSATLNATARKVASGAAELIPVFRVGNLARCLRQLKKQGLWLTGLSGDTAGTIYDTDLTMPTVLVLGAEGRGLRQLSRKECDHLAAIPMPGSIESLNVSVAAGICLFEAARQRRP